RVRGRRGARAERRAAVLAHPSALRHGVPALGDGDRGIRLRALRPARVVLADRDADPAPAGDCVARVRADPLRGQALVESRRADPARTRTLAAAPDDARADARAARG